MYRKVETILRLTCIYSPFISHYWHLPIRFRKCHLPSPLSFSLHSFIHHIFWCISKLLTSVLSSPKHFNVHTITPITYLFICCCCPVAKLCPTLQPRGLWHARLSFTISQSLLKLMSLESVMPSNHLILCHPLLLLPSISASIRIFFSESALLIRWPKYWGSFSFESQCYMLLNAHTLNGPWWLTSYGSSTGTQGVLIKHHFWVCWEAVSRWAEHWDRWAVDGVKQKGLLGVCVCGGGQRSWNPRRVWINKRASCLPACLLSGDSNLLLLWEPSSSQNRTTDLPGLQRADGISWLPFSFYWSPWAENIRCYFSASACF